jgi:hypothetical protein
MGSEQEMPSKKKKAKEKKGSTYLALSLLFSLHLTLQFLDSVGVLAHLLTLSV